LPPYAEDSDIDKLIGAIENKKTPRGCIVRDLLLVELALKTGIMRRDELANLKSKDIHADFLVIRDGKGGKDRVIPLGPAISQRLHGFIKGKEANENVFGLKAPCITDKIRKYAKKAGLDNFHTHTMRHKFATDLLEKGTNIKVVQELLGHENLDTTQVYLSVTNQSLRDAVNVLDKKAITHQDKNASALKSKDDKPERGERDYGVLIGENGKEYIYKKVLPPELSDLYVPPCKPNK